MENLQIILFSESHKLNETNFAVRQQKMKTILTYRDWWSMVSVKIEEEETKFKRTVVIEAKLRQVQEDKKSTK